MDGPTEIFCESLLASEVDENINLVRDIFDYKPADALFKTPKSATLYVLSVHKIRNVSVTSKEKIVAKACEYYLDSSKGCFLSDGVSNFVKSHLNYNFLIPFLPFVC